ncbi:ATP-binding cassette domain-containing protein [Cupriavidus campinensis]|uniref:ATP-binding cassette domain-containing protein n=1 Tax=Cupriavidus campinensis TaxID=151783 RepID=UPI00292A4391|nr:ATP-binding cassette domain-containing protein [Cupriavidus campinensis]
MTHIDTHPLLAVDALNVASADGQLLAPVSFTLEAGRALTLLGESGSGKSLLAHALMGTLPHGLRAGGTLTVDGRRCDAADPATRRAMWGRQLALLPQEPWFALDPTMRVGRQLAETHALAGLGNAQAWQRALHDLHGLGMAHAAQAWPTTLSGGMAQRVAFAITRAGGAPVLIVDEPTKGLDRVWRDELVARLQAALGVGCALLTITHDIAVARALGAMWRSCSTAGWSNGATPRRSSAHPRMPIPARWWPPNRRTGRRCARRRPVAMKSCARVA